MKKFFSVIIVIFFGFIIGGFGAIVNILRENPKFFTGFFPAEESVIFKDESRVIESPVSTLPRVYTPKARLEDLIVQVREEKRLAEEVDCEKQAEMFSGIGKLVSINANITTFAGPKDWGVTPRETGSVSGRLLRKVNPEEIFVAWPMPSVHEGNPKSPFALPSVEEFFAEEDDDKLSEKIEQANLSLRDYFCEVTHVDESGNEKTILARIEDRGPAKATRFDASRGLWRALGLCEVLNGSPNSKENRVKLEVRLVHKDRVAKVGDQLLVVR